LAKFSKSKRGELVVFPKKKEKIKRKIPLTREDKEDRIDHAEKKIKKHKQAVTRTILVNPCLHGETIMIKNKLTCRYCGEIVG